MITIDNTTCQKVHTRTIEVATYAVENDAVIVEGRLEDNRLFDSYRSDGDVVPPGVVHHMNIRLKIRGPQLTIEEVAVAMPTVPSAACLETRASLEPIKGMAISAGFTLKVKELVGGCRGCAHLVALLNAMASAAVQGAWSAATRRPEIAAAVMTHTLDRVKNTCHVWRSDGPVYAKHKAKLRKQAIKGGDTWDP